MLKYDFCHLKNTKFYVSCLYVCFVGDRHWLQSTVLYGIAVCLWAAGCQSGSLADSRPQPYCYGTDLKIVTCFTTLFRRFLLLSKSDIIFRLLVFCWYNLIPYLLNLVKYAESYACFSFARQQQLFLFADGCRWLSLCALRKTAVDGNFHCTIVYALRRASVGFYLVYTKGFRRWYLLCEKLPLVVFHTVHFCGRLPLVALSVCR